MFNPQEEQRLRTLQQEADHVRNDAAERFQSAQLRSSEGTDRFFERLALFDVSTVALTITFVANAHLSFSHFWVLRTSWVFFLASVICCAARAWQHNSYMLAVFHRFYLESEADVHSTRKEMYLKSQGRLLDKQTGKSPDRGKAAEIAENNSKNYKTVATERKGEEEKAYDSFRIQERAAMLFAFCGLLALCFWASMNFPV